MKTALVRMLALTALATSLSGLAAAESKNDANTFAANQRNGCSAAGNQEKKQTKEKKRRNDSREEQELDRVLMGIYG